MTIAKVSPAPPPAYRWPEYDDTTAFRKLRAAAHMKEKRFKKTHSPDGRGLLPYLFRSDGSRRFHDIGMTYRDGVGRAARAGSIVIDLDNPRATLPGLRRIYQPANLNAVLMMGGIAEEAGMAVFKSPNQAWFDAAEQDGVDREEATQIAEMRQLAARCNTALMAEVYRGVMPAEAPIYTKLRALPISLRSRCGWVVDPSIDYNFRLRGADLIDQYPLAALMWSRIQQAATARGAKLREIADGWGFARSTTKIPAQALSAINYRLAIDGRDEEATAEELAPLDDALCDMLPEGAFRGKQVVDLTILAASRGLPPEEASAFGQWAAPHIAKLTKERDLPDAARVLLADYRAASPDALAEAGGFEPWRNTMTLRGAQDFSRRFVLALAEAREPKGSARIEQWDAPVWSLGDPPPPPKGRAWFPVFLGSRLMLHWAGCNFHNCAATYASICIDGRSAIYAIVRRPIKTDKPSSIIDLPGIGPVVRGAMLELRKTPAGKCRRMQLTGFANAPEHTLPNSLTNAVHRWIAARNALCNNSNGE